MDAPLERLRIVLCRPSHPGNIGAAARAMKTMGITDLRLVAPSRFPAPEAQWLATHALDVLEAARTHATLGEALADCNRVLPAGIHPDMNEPDPVVPGRLRPV